MDGKTILPRNEVPEEFTWNLTELFAAEEDWSRELEALARLPETIEGFRGRLCESAQTLLAWGRLNDEVSGRLQRLVGYAMCRRDEDTANGKYQSLVGKATHVATEISRAASFVRNELIAPEDELFDRFESEEPELKIYRRSLQLLRRRKEHILAPECERLLSSMGEMARAPENIGSMLRDADMIYPEVTDAEGRSHALTNGTFVPLLMSGDRALRKNAFETYYKQQEAFKNTFAATLDAQFKKLCFQAQSRRFETTRQAALFYTEVPEAVYDSLIDAVHANLDKMYRYVALRKKILKANELCMYDVYVPMVSDAEQRIPFEQAKQTVCEALSVLGEDYVALLKKAFDERWMDVYENKGKRSGAYSTGLSRPHPYVLLNHKDDLDSQFTLAHELGHALHSYHSTQHQPPCTADYVIFVAEVASTCNEVLLMRYLLDRTADKTTRAYLINHFLDQFKGTLYRQTMFAEFEREMGRLAESGETLTAELLCEKYLALNKLYFGPDMISGPEIALEWTRIPHFFYNYYVFQYATGFSAAVAIANRILTEGAPAVADYKRFLSSGCSEDPVSLLKIAGVDMSAPEPVNNALAMFGELVGELETLLYE